MRVRYFFGGGGGGGEVSCDKGYSNWQSVLASRYLWELPFRFWALGLGFKFRALGSELGI